MINPSQNNAIFRNYEGVIAESKAKTHQKASQSAIKDGQARRKVEQLQEQRQLNKEINLWET